MIDWFLTPWGSLLLITLLLVAGLTIWWGVGTQLYPLVVRPAAEQKGGGPKPEGRKADEDKGEGPAADAPPPSEWRQRFEVRESELQSRGQFGDTFGVAGALFGGISAMLGVFTLLFLIVTIREQRAQIGHQNEQERVRDRHDKERLLIDLSLRYWSPEFTARREQAWQIAEMLMPALNVSVARARSEHQWLADDIYRPYSDRLLKGLVESHVGRDLDHGYELRKFVAQFVREQYARRHDADFEGREFEAADQMLRSFAEVLALFATHASVLLGTDPPLTDYMGNQWDYWGGVLVGFVERCREARPPGTRPAFWEVWLPLYDDHYRRGA